MKFHGIKKEIRVVGITFCPYYSQEDEFTDVIGVVYRGGYLLDGILKGRIRVRGSDATEKIVTMITSSPHYDQLRVVILDGVIFAGNNIVNVRKLFEQTGLPVIAVSEEKPDVKAIKKTFREASFKEGWEQAEVVGEFHTLRVADNVIYFQVAGVNLQDSEEIIVQTSKRGYAVPEALRVARMIARRFVQRKN